MESILSDPIREKWNLIKETIRKEYELSNISYSTWIEPLKFYKVDGDNVLIIIPIDQAHAINYISNKYTSFFQVTITEMMDKNYTVSFILEKDIEDENDKKDKSKLSTYNIIYDRANLNPKYTFDTFVVGNNNKFAHSAALAVAETPGGAYNPLFIYGGAGLGKTHLMHSIGRFILEQNSEMKVLYVTSEQFTNEVIESIRSGNAATMTKLREKYRTVDVLMIDDVQFIIGKESTQEEFFTLSMCSTEPVNRLCSPPINLRKKWKPWRSVSDPVLSGGSSRTSSPPITRQKWQFCARMPRFMKER